MLPSTEEADCTLYPDKMADYLGSKISLVSNSNIRYVGVLHEINSEQSTVALKQGKAQSRNSKFNLTIKVRSYGTEGRRGNPAEEIAPSHHVFEYIVFRGTDVKDLQIMEETTAKQPPPPETVPSDPAIVGVCWLLLTPMLIQFRRENQLRGIISNRRCISNLRRWASTFLHHSSSIVRDIHLHHQGSWEEVHLLTSRCNISSLINSADTLRLHLRSMDVCKAEGDRRRKAVRILTSDGLSQCNPE